MQPHNMLLWFVAGALIPSIADARPNVNTGEAKTAETCGQEMAASAEVPQRWQELMNHVAANMEWHATWAGIDSAAAKREHDALLRVAGEYRAMAASAGRAATAMKAMRDLAPTPHDSSKVDLEGQARWMRAKIKMQRQFATLLTRHAEDSEKALAEMEARPAP
jgi:hypothetical protein